MPALLNSRKKAEKITAAGLSIGIVFQSAGNSRQSFSKSKGRKDARSAFNYAINTIGQPGNTAIYFAVDYNATKKDLSDKIIPHFREVNAINNSGEFSRKFRIGGYGSGLTLETLLKEGLIELSWLSQSTGHRRSKAFKESNIWTIFQHMPSKLCGLGLDRDTLNPGLSGYGEFTTLLQPGANEPSPGPRPTPAPNEPQKFKITARSGLRLRGGPGTSFDIITALPFGSEVFGLERRGDWMIVDIHGDQIADGAMHTAFLKEIA